MKIAVTYENGQIFQHFGHTEAFKIYEVEDQKVVSSEVVSTNGSGHGALAGFLTEHGVQVLICGGIGGGAQNALASAGIQLFGGVSGNADDAVNALLGNSLNYNPDVKCNHHGEHEHHGDCGSHEHNCGHHCG
ncbi:MAG: NifB/NifX family molybdenum-iron cluster-binding protein [Eubacteriales bacterium]|nr:NifB/NifX family molybdenum-iron cluster-binding protein [Eubacteriales bacterium]